MKIYFFFLHSSFLPPNYYFRCHLHTFNPNDMAFLLLDFGGKEVKHEIKIRLLLPKCVLNRWKLFSLELFGPYHNLTWYVCQLHTKSDIFIAQTRQGYNNQPSTHVKNVCITLLTYTTSCQHQRLIILITWMNAKQEKCRLHKLAPQYTCNEKYVAHSPTFHSILIVHFYIKEVTCIYFN